MLRFSSVQSLSHFSLLLSCHSAGDGKGCSGVHTAWTTSELCPLVLLIKDSVVLFLHLCLLYDCHAAVLLNLLALEMKAVISKDWV